MDRDARGDIDVFLVAANGRRLLDGPFDPAACPAAAKSAVIWCGLASIRSHVYCHVGSVQRYIRQGGLGRGQERVDITAVHLLQVGLADAGVQDLALLIHADLAAACAGNIERVGFDAGIDDQHILARQGRHLIDRALGPLPVHLGQVIGQKIRHVARPDLRLELLGQRSHAAAQLPDRTAQRQRPELLPLILGPVDKNQPHGGPFHHLGTGQVLVNAQGSRRQEIHLASLPKRELLAFGGPSPHP